MPSVSELLEQESRTVDLERGHFERLLRRRDRKRRNQRIGAGALAIIIALVSFVALTRAFRSAPVPVDTPEPLPITPGDLAYLVDGDLYVADWDGANPVRIANGRPLSGADDCSPPEYSASGPIWSPDGRYLAYRWSCQDAPGGVMINDEDGNFVASFPCSTLGWLVSWSPDSTRVAVWVTWGKTIGIYGLDGQRRKVLTLPPGLMAAGDFDPVWSQDGASLLVPHGVKIPLDGSTPRQLPPDDPRSKPFATFSPDGSRVAYVDDGGLFFAAADGSDARVVVGGFVVNPVWSPTGNQIVFAYWESYDLPHATELRVFDVTTGTVTPLVGESGSDWLTVIEFSPEGDRILFGRQNDMGRGEASLWSVRTDGSDPRRLVAGVNEGDWR